MDVLDFYRGRLSARRLLLLLRRLPPDSEFFRKAMPDQAHEATWGPTEHLLADLFDLTFAAATRGSKQKPPTYPRPAEQLAARRGAEYRARFLEEQAERNRLRDEAEGR